MGALSVNLGPDQNICEETGDTARLDAGKHYGYFWFPTGSGRYKVIDTAGTYVVMVVDTDLCYATDTIHIIDRCPPRLFVPTAFTPNGDGINDSFVPKGWDIGNYHLRVSNRWGETLYQSDTLEKGWDGKFEKIKSPEGEYIWDISYDGYVRNVFYTYRQRGIVNLLK